MQFQCGFVGSHVKFRLLGLWLAYPPGLSARIRSLALFELLEVVWQVYR